MSKYIRNGGGKGKERGARFLSRFCFLRLVRFREGEGEEERESRDGGADDFTPLLPLASGLLLGLRFRIREREGKRKRDW